MPYQEGDLRSDDAQGYLRQKGGDQVNKGAGGHKNEWGGAGLR